MVRHIGVLHWIFFIVFIGFNDCRYQHSFRGKDFVTMKIEDTAGIVVKLLVQTETLLSNALIRESWKLRCSAAAVGDEVVEWNGRSLRSLTFEDVYDIIFESKSDRQVELTVERSLSRAEMHGYRMPEQLDDVEGSSTFYLIVYFFCVRLLSLL